MTVVRINNILTDLVLFIDMETLSATLTIDDNPIVSFHQKERDEFLFKDGYITLVEPTIVWGFEEQQIVLERDEPFKDFEALETYLKTYLGLEAEIV